jgi:hypothetical protein
MAPRANLLRRGLCAALAVSAVPALVPSSALAGKLPKQGIWFYDSTPTMKVTAGYVEFRAYLRVGTGKSSIYSFDAVVIGGTCKMTNGRSVPDSLVGGNVLKTLVPVKPDGSFSAMRSAVGDTGGKGTLIVRGVITGAHVTGSVTAHMHDPNWGDCRGTGKFVLAKGNQIG